MTNQKPKYEILHQPWKARPFLVIWNFCFSSWDIVSHHASIESAQNKLAAMNGAK